MKMRVLSIGFLLYAAVLLVPHAGYADVKEITITVDGSGFHPSKVSVEKGEAVKLIFIRNTDTTCITKVVIPDLDIDQELPLNEPVAINISPDKSGSIGFICPMKMLKGEITVTEKK